MKELITTVLLDLDGTLTDPALGITNCIAYALSRLDATVPPSKELHFAIGPPLRASFATLLGADDPVTIERAMALYRERFADIGLFENSIYDGVPEMLASLKAQNRRLLLATAKPHVYAQRILAHFAIDTPFDGVYGSELDGTRQHKGDLSDRSRAYRPGKRGNDRRPPPRYRRRARQRLSCDRCDLRLR